MAGHEVKTYTAADIGLQTGRQSRCAIEVRNCTSTHCIPHVTNRHRLFHICIYLQGVSKNKLARVLRFLIHHHRRRCHHVHFERLKMCAAYNEYCALPTKIITRSFSSCSLVFDLVFCNISWTCCTTLKTNTCMCFCASVGLIHSRYYPPVINIIVRTASPGRADINQ